MVDLHPKMTTVSPECQTRPGNKRPVKTSCTHRIRSTASFNPPPTKCLMKVNSVDLLFLPQLCGYICGLIITSFWCLVLGVGIFCTLIQRGNKCKALREEESSPPSCTGCAHLVYILTWLYFLF